MTLAPLRSSIAPLRSSWVSPDIVAERRSEQERNRRLHDREVVVNARERELDRREHDIEARERRLERKAREQRQEERAAAAELAMVEARQAEGLPAPLSLSEQIIFWGKVRRGEAAAPQRPISKQAADILRSAALARGELVDAPAPKTESERLAAAVILAGKRRRGEVD
jgi:hypothetical protein